MGFKVEGLGLGPVQVVSILNPPEWIALRVENGV